MGKKGSNSVYSFPWRWSIDGRTISTSQCRSNDASDSTRREEGKLTTLDDAYTSWSVVLLISYEATRLFVTSARLSARNRRGAMIAVKIVNNKSFGNGGTIDNHAKRYE